MSAGAVGGFVSITIGVGAEADATAPAASSTLAVTLISPSGNAAVGFKVQLPDASAVSSGDLPRT